ncbi:potassium transporter 6-like [Pyrus ussuriensis x Pyrus communis]|uniref:Potassium transporter 6-like n=1 Tax=Pyrus ussuriensis x Pyrus communis TaxID=2448454 RepID=A0A5N5G649_9ROSA|nr:potassium transporter 6-like [Pyrus ussuriensis x Pyrus communis]
MIPQKRALVQPLPLLLLFSGSGYTAAPLAGKEARERVGAPLVGRKANAPGCSTAVQPQLRAFPFENPRQSAQIAMDDVEALVNQKMDWEDGLDGLGCGSTDSISGDPNDPTIGLVMAAAEPNNVVRREPAGSRGYLQMCHNSY